MFKKTVKKTFEYEEFNGRLTLEITIKRLSKYENDLIQKDIISKLQLLTPEDRKTLLTSIEEGAVNEALAKLSNVDIITDLMSNMDSRMKHCVVKAKAIIEQEGYETEVIDDIDEVFKHLSEKELAWVAEEINKYNPTSIDINEKKS